MNELEFTALVAGWINQIIRDHPELPFSDARCEQSRKGSLKRRDLTLLDRNHVVVLTGEIKLPYQKDGNSPYNAALVADARTKARQAKTDFFFTWNVNDFVLWQTTPANISWQKRDYRSWHVTSVHTDDHMSVPSTEDAIKAFLGQFLRQFSQILRGASPIGSKSPDQKFVEALESSLDLPSVLVFEELQKGYKKSRFRSELDKWMREEQGWVIRDDPEGIRDNLQRASKFACYALVNKLVFHEALLKRYGRKMDRLTVPDHIETADALRTHLEGYFADAKTVTGDYETVFGEDHRSLGNRIPFYSDRAVPHWRQLINQIHQFDFSKLDYDVIGTIFERLISPEERHKFGQFYTRVEVVDLINSFCILNGTEKVMDPACGGGTFLVRAYARKRELRPNTKHRDLLYDLFGVDISHFATHLTTINLTTRDLVEQDNYPQIARKNFFDVDVAKVLVSLPRTVQSTGLGEMQHRDVRIPPLDAVIANPPYIRQEDIPSFKTKAKGSLRPGTKQYYSDLVTRESTAHLSGRSDIHCYFWPHASTFLKEDGHLCFLTSSQWLDVEYGFHLQEWILRNFQIVAVFESIDEPWFVGARVATAVTILRRAQDAHARMDNAVRFIQLRRPMSEILANDGSTAGAVSAADQFRDEVLSLRHDTVNERYRARLVPQARLWHQGVNLGVMMGKSKDSGDAHGQPDDYYGGKWGIYLRAPDLWFDLLDKYGARFAPLGDIADVHRGITSGKDDFFFPRDCSDECLQAHQDKSEFLLTYGVPRRHVQSGRVKLVRCGEKRGEIRPIESKYLEPEVHSLIEITGFSVSPQECTRQILLVGHKRGDIRDKHVLDYITWGESKGYHKGSTCASRVTADRDWYDLTGHARGALFWPMAQQYRHIVPSNDSGLICNHNLFDVSPGREDANTLGGVLNSTWVLLSKYQYGRPVGVEGNLKTEVVDVKMMLIPDPRHASAAKKERVANAFRRLKQRKALQFISQRRMHASSGRASSDDLSDLCELDMPDRRDLDDAVLQMLGERAAKRRNQLIDGLYAYLREFFELTRQKEEKAIANKKKAKRRGPARPADIAAQLLLYIRESEPHLLRRYDADFVDSSKPFDTFDLPEQGTPTPYSDVFSANGVEFTKGKRTHIAIVETKSPVQAQLLVLAAASGFRGLLRVPRADDECRRVLQDLEKSVRGRDKRLRSLVEDRTVDEQLQQKILAALLPMLSHNR